MITQSNFIIGPMGISFLPFPDDPGLQPGMIMSIGIKKNFIHIFLIVLLKRVIINNLIFIFRARLLRRWTVWDQIRKLGCY